MFGNSRSGGYDRAITIFSPDGRLFQVEYAIEAVNRGTVAIAALNDEGVVFCVEKRQLTLQESLGSEKIFKIDNHIGVAIAGLTADARTLVDKARVEAQINILSYDSKITVLEATKTVCDEKQLYTQNAGVRPFGVALLIGGIDPELNEPQLYMTDPSGAFWGYKATAIGRNASSVRDFFEGEYKEDLGFDELLTLVLKALSTVIETESLSVSDFEVAVIKKEEPVLRFLDNDECQSYLDNLEQDAA